MGKSRALLVILRVSIIASSGVFNSYVTVNSIFFGSSSNVNSSEQTKLVTSLRRHRQNGYWLKDRSLIRRAALTTAINSPARYAFG